MSKQLIAYFSASGTTQAAAERLAKMTGSDLFEIKPESPYTRADLDWNNPNSRSSKEVNNPHSRPAIAQPVANISQYDTVFIGFPIWWGIAPPIINTFITSYDFSGTTIVPFATSGGSGIDKAIRVLKPLCSSSAHWENGAVLNHISHQELLSWVNCL